MNVDYGKDFFALRVVGGFLALASLYKLYEIYERYFPGVMRVASVGEVMIIGISSLIALYCMTMFWRVEFNANNVITQYGFLLLKKRKEFNGIESIQFRVQFIEVKNGPSKAYLAVYLKPKDRAKAYPIASMHQLSKGILPKSTYKKAFVKEAYEFKEKLSELKALYPNIAIDVGEKMEDFYAHLFGTEFKW